MQKNKAQLEVVEYAQTRMKEQSSGMTLEQLYAELEMGTFPAFHSHVAERLPSFRLAILRQLLSAEKRISADGHEVRVFHCTGTRTVLEDEREVQRPLWRDIYTMDEQEVVTVCKAYNNLATANLVSGKEFLKEYNAIHGTQCFFSFWGD